MKIFCAGWRVVSLLVAPSGELRRSTSAPLTASSPTDVGFARLRRAPELAQTTRRTARGPGAHRAFRGGGAREGGSRSRICARGAVGWRGRAHGRWYLDVHGIPTSAVRTACGRCRRLARRFRPPRVASTARVRPSPTRRSFALQREGYVRYLVSCNVDCLHLRSGFPREEMAELHGNCFAERCERCGREYVRDFEMPSVGFKRTGRKCGSDGRARKTSRPGARLGRRAPARRAQARGAPLADDAARDRPRLQPPDPPVVRSAAQDDSKATETARSRGRGTGTAPGRARHRQPPEDPEDAKATVVIHAKTDGVMARIVRMRRLDPRPVRPARRGAGFARDVGVGEEPDAFDLRVDSRTARARRVGSWLVGVKVEFECAGGHRTPIKPCVASLGPERNARGLKWRRKMPKGAWLDPSRALHPSSRRGVRGGGGDVRARHRGGVEGVGESRDVRVRNGPRGVPPERQHASRRVPGWGDEGVGGAGRFLRGRARGLPVDADEETERTHLNSSDEPNRPTLRHATRRLSPFPPPRFPLGACEPGTPRFTARPLLRWIDVPSPPPRAPDVPVSISARAALHPKRDDVERDRDPTEVLRETTTKGCSIGTKAGTRLRPGEGTKPKPGSDGAARAGPHPRISTMGTGSTRRGAASIRLLGLLRRPGNPSPRISAATSGGG